MIALTYTQRLALIKFATRLHRNNPRAALALLIAGA